MIQTKLDNHVAGRAPSSVSTELLMPDRSLPLVIRPNNAAFDLIEWARENREYVDAALAKHGALLFRGFDIGGAATFGQFIKTLSGDLIEYHERSSPRSEVGERVYTSTNYPARQRIFPHNEQSYNLVFPLKIVFYCQTPAAQGGETPIGDTRRVYQRLDPRIRERFMEKGYMYVRNFGDGLGLPWQDVFLTSDRAAVEAYCRRADIECEWKTEDRLKTRQIRRAVARHPGSGDMTWFNHATFFHVSTLEPTMQEVLLGAFAEEELPNNTYYGDGSRIEPAVMDELREAYWQEMVYFPWQAQDVLMLDNMLASHGRQPFSGPRKILTVMAEPFSWNDIK